MRKSLFLSLLICAFPTLSTSFNETTSLLPSGSQYALQIYDLKKQKMLVSHHSNLLLPPASTQKILTALAARLYLKKNFRFKTRVFTNNNDLVFQFGGDPTLMRTHVQSLVKTIKTQMKGKAVNHIWLDTNVFTGYQNAIGLPWDILGVCYSAPSTALSIERNCVQASIYTNQKTGKTRAYLPAHQPIEVSTRAITVTKETQEKRRCDLELNYNQNNQYQLNGCLAARKTPLPLKFAIQNPEAYFIAILRAELAKSGIDMKGQFKRGKGEPSQLIAEHTSAPRDALLTEMLKDSDNLISDNLLKYIGHLYHQSAGTFANGADAIQRIIHNGTRIDLTPSVMVDGSGLSRNNRLTAGQLMALLEWIYKNDRHIFDAMLPISGTDGTLKYRRSLRDNTLKGKIKAKTGSLFGTYNLAGLVQTNQGSELLVVQFVTNYHSSHLKTNTPPPITQFEHQLYRQLVNQF